MAKASLLVKRVLFLGVILVSLEGTVTAQDPAFYSFSWDSAFPSSFVRRGQVFTNDWTFQSAGTLAIGGLGLSVWGNLDLTAANESDLGSITDTTLRGKFSEVDYNFSYTIESAETFVVTWGAAVYTFPERPISLPTTTELFASVSFPYVPFTPTADVHVDVDETRETGLGSGLYLSITVQKPIEFDSRIVGSVNLSVRTSFVNSSYAQYWHELSASGWHDIDLVVSVPFAINSEWTSSAFVSYTALLGDFRNQALPPSLLARTSELPEANTLWFGFTVSLSL